MASKVDETKCNGCSSCVESCAVDAIKVENEKALITEACIDCAACHSACPNEAISMVA